MGQSFPDIFSSCLRPDVTWGSEGEIDVIPGVPSPELCQQLCQRNESCQAITWLDENFPVVPLSCTLFAELDKEISCSNCVSGESRCSCAIPGECGMQDHNVVDIHPGVQSIQECQALCEKKKSCELYTYLGQENAFSKMCVLYSSCPEFINNCTDCFTGKNECSVCPYEFTNPDGSCSLDWVVIQRRGQFGNPEDYFSSKLWDDYVNGFGDEGKEFWLGLKTISNLTSSGVWELRVDLVDFQGNNYTAQYSHFKVDQEEPYRLTVIGFDEDVSNIQDSLSLHNNMGFTTTDNDNDESTGNCAVAHSGAWWYKRCHTANLNGLNINNATGDYGNGINWINDENVVEQDYTFSWPSVQMKIRRTL